MPIESVVLCRESSFEKYWEIVFNQLVEFCEDDTTTCYGCDTFVNLLVIRGTRLIYLWGILINSFGNIVNLTKTLFQRPTYDSYPCCNQLLSIYLTCTGNSKSSNGVDSIIGALFFVPKGEVFQFSEYEYLFECTICIWLWDNACCISKNMNSPSKNSGCNI